MDGGSNAPAGGGSLGIIGVAWCGVAAERRNDKGSVWTLEEKGSEAFIKRREPKARCGSSLLKSDSVSDPAVRN